MFRRVLINVNRETQGAQTPELSVSLLQDFYLNPQESDIDAWKKLGPSASAADLKKFISTFPESVMLDAARARLDAIENASERERLAREYADKERPPAPGSRSRRSRLQEGDVGVVGAPRTR